ncbi:MAG: glycosyltransferase family 4 protein [Chloroflexota bacterium]|nr:MAG: glycosyl transferase family 1 [Chloroflexota bacterium]
MRVAVLSKALVVGTYRRKLQEMARLGIDVVAIVPPEWREGGGVQRLEQQSDLGYRVLVTPIRWNGHFHLHYYPNLARVLRDIQPDLLHVDEEPYNLSTFLAVRSAREMNIPSVFFSWQNLARRYPPPFSWMESYVYHNVRAAIAGSSEAARVLRDKGFDGPVAEIPQFGVDPDLFHTGGAKCRPFTVGFPNRLVPAKGPMLAVNAFARLPADARLKIVGDGPMRGEIEAAVRNLHLGDRVSLQPRMPSAEMPDYLRSVDVVLLPSVSTSRWKEQFGRVLIEAMSCGVPVVASDSGEIPRVLGDAGLIVPEGDESSLADALLRLYRDSLLRTRLGQRGRARVLERFTHARVAEATVGLYREVLKKRA